MTTDSLETLFVKLTNLDEPVIVGVVYRPPSGDTNLFQSEFRDVLSSLPTDHSVYILTVDLLSESHNDTAKFKNVIFFCRLYSTHLHFNKRKVSIKEKFIFTSQSNYIFYIYIFTKYHEFLKCVQI